VQIPGSELCAADFKIAMMRCDGVSDDGIGSEDSLDRRQSFAQFASVVKWSGQEIDAPLWSVEHDAWNTLRFAPEAGWVGGPDSPRGRKAWTRLVQ